MLDVFVLHFEKVDGALPHELKRRLKLFNRSHLYAEEFHSHQKRDDALGRVGGGFPRPQLLQLVHKTFSNRLESTLRQDADHLGVKVSDNVEVLQVRPLLGSFPKFEMFEREVLDIEDEILMARMEW